MSDRPSDVRHPYLKIPDVIAINIIAAVAAVAAVVAMVESYTNLLEFARANGLSGWRSAAAPAAVDSFIIIGELILFVSLVRSWDRRPQWYGWLLAGAGFAVSVAGNVTHNSTAGIASRMMSALFPIAATAGLAAGLMILKRVTATYRENVQPIRSGQPQRTSSQPSTETSQPSVNGQPRISSPQPEHAGQPKKPSPQPQPSRQPAQRSPRKTAIHAVPDMSALQADVKAGLTVRQLAAKYQITRWTANKYQVQYRKEA